MQSMMGATYPGPGINLGPAVVFAYAAAQAATEHVGEAAQVRSPGTRTLGACQ
jgi:hypothetical protein